VTLPKRRTTSDARFVAAIERWFEQFQRDLPWRRVDPATSRRDPYRSLVSEVMLQQTQVARVIEKFQPFLARFPDVGSLANATDEDVLAAWTGLGYYRRARSLHAAARQIVDTHDGVVPHRLVDLLDLPGVGRYTAGAIASIVFGHPAAIVDGNVSRVLFRVHGKDLAADDPDGVAWAWKRAQQLVELASPALFNEGMMELGATICTPANPGCDRCPVRAGCLAKRHGTQGRIPRPKTPASQREQWHVCVLVRDRDGRVLLERASSGTLWKGLWRAPTTEFSVPGRRRGWESRKARAIARSLALRATPTPTAQFAFKTSACLVHFRVFIVPALARVAADKVPGIDAHRRWFTPAQARRIAVSSPTSRMLDFSRASS
jgi:A/G-specific adenine glycosylase